VGACAGAGLYAEAAAVTVFVLGGNTLLRPLVNFINRQPMSPGETEALYRVHVTCAQADVSQARDLLYEELELHHYPIQDIDTLSESEDVVELAASLVPTTANPHDLDTIVVHLQRSEPIRSATWTVSTLS
jgi:putative Mg2+ transporter-C (MgtC) family protein